MVARALLKKRNDSKNSSRFWSYLSGGILGRIHQVGSNSSKVELATNTNFRIVAHFQGDKRPVTFQGTGVLLGGQPMGAVLDVPHDIQIRGNEGLLLETSSLGGTFRRFTNRNRSLS